MTDSSYTEAFPPKQLSSSPGQKSTPPSPDPNAKLGLGQPPKPSVGQPSSGTPKVGSGKPSSFANMPGAPQIEDTESIKKLDTDVSIEFCLEQGARVLEELAEKQEDPAWVEAHRTLAEQWLGYAQAIMDYYVRGVEMKGELELKNQQLQQQHDQHHQALTQQDAKHAQDQTHADAQHKLAMQHQTATQQVELKTKTDMAKQSVAQRDQAHKAQMKTQTDLGKQALVHKDQVHKTKLAQQAKPKPKPRESELDESESPSPS